MDFLGFFLICLGAIALVHHALKPVVASARLRPDTAGDRLDEPAHAAHSADA